MPKQLTCLLVFSAVGWFWLQSLLAQRLPSGATVSEQLLQLATAYLQAGNLPAAEAELRKALAQAPHDVTALSMLGGILGMQRRLEESSRQFEKVLQLEPGNAPARRNLCANQMQLGQLAAARKNLEMLLKADPADAQSSLMLGLTLQRQRQYALAIPYLEKVSQLVWQQSDSVAALARCYYRTGKKEKGRDQLNRLQTMLSDPAAIYTGGTIALEAGDWEQAEKLFSSIRSSYPNPTLVTYQLAKIRYQTGRYGESKFLLESIANSSQSNGAVLNLLAWCYLKEGNEETAAKILSYAIDKFPEEASNFIDLGKISLQRGRVNPGLEIVERGAARHAGSAALLELKGELESKAGLHAKAVDSYAKAVKLNPQSPESLLGLATAQTNLLQNREAVATFEKGLRLFPRYARFCAEYGKTLLLPWASGEIPGASAKAEQMLRKAIQLDGTLALAHFELGNFLVKNSRAEEAFPHLQAAAKLDSKNTETHFVLARAYRALGRTEEAEREMKLFQQLEPTAKGGNGSKQ
jgi:tetratricopeptide (TPR) repeat protein